ncbi:UBP1-associated protein 2B [Forsythia ovata]|uniref:UBP1-associated protein 2B n=1 Tax=Forsythia ovata TaxID=205694 RepID=A0ABD1SPF9_9LAMI
MTFNFTREIEYLLKEAATKDTELFNKIVQVADSDPTHRKIFVHGIGWDATSDQLLMSFKPFGEVEECKLITDKNTGRAKGYAFVLFKTRAAAKKALKVPQKKIGNRVVSCQLASAGPTTPTQASEPSSWKVFVGNVGPNVNAEKLKEFFRKFGEIEEGPIGLDPVTNKFRGFAVITYKSAEGYKKALEEPFKVFENCHLHCKKFGENHNNKNSMAGQNSLTSVNPAVPDVNYGSLGATPAILGANLNPGGLLMAQNPGIGLAGSAMLASSISPSMIESYGSQAAFQGLGAYQSAQMGQSPVLEWQSTHC